MTEANNHLSSAVLAKALLRSEMVILDTETTGLREGEIVQIAIIDSTGQPLLDTFVKPTISIPYGATDVHGITDAMVSDAPGWGMVSSLVRQIIGHKHLVIYNANYDMGMLWQSSEAVGDGGRWRSLPASIHCAMEMYAAFFGDWNDYHHSYRWQRLTAACEQQGIPEPQAPAHSALGDCLRTLELLKIMAKVADQEAEQP